MLRVTYKYTCEERKETIKGEKRLDTEAVEGASGALESVDDVEGSDGLAEGTSDNILLRASIQLTA